MSLLDRLNQDYVAAYKAHDSIRVTVLRLLKTAAKNKQVALMRPLDDSEVIDVIGKEAKQRLDSIEQFTGAGRTDLAEREQAELNILKEYLPAALSAEELAAAIEAAVAETGVTDVSGMSKVMNALLASNKGRIDGKTASAAVRARLLKQ